MKNVATSPVPSLPWPTQVDYQDALNDPRACFIDPDLQERIVTHRTPFGAPQPISGQFTNVYRLQSADNTSGRAVRLFLRDAGQERTRHYRALAAHLQSLTAPLPFLVPFAYQEQGIKMGGYTYPLVKMDWVEGVLLNEWVEKHLYESGALKKIAAQWRALVLSLENARMAHGDLQHGNIILVEGELRLLDYDAAVVPAMVESAAREAGHPSYQHPRRAGAPLNLAIDRFSALVIYAALKALAAAPELWFRLDNGDNLLFRREDYQDPQNSRAFTLMQTTLLRAPEAARVVYALREACKGMLTQVPPLDRF
jgi:hypothetical protein